MELVELVDPEIEERLAGENEAIAKVVEGTRAFIKDEWDKALKEWDEQSAIKDPPPPKPLAHRDAHPFHHGVVKATLRVNDLIDKDLRWGLFADPGREYPCWVRLSNGSPEIQSDHVPDGRGMAIKVCGVEGERHPSARQEHTQDFVLIDHPAFFVATPRQYVHFVRLQRAGKQRNFFISLNPCHWHLRLGFVAVKVTRVIPSMLDNRYFSMSPFKLGPLAVKYACRSVDASPGKIPGKKNERFLRDDLRSRLQKGPSRFELTAQTRTHASKMPIEDASAYWSEKLSPHRPLATLTIPKQTFDSDEQRKFGEYINYSPWNCLLAHAPLGGLNRIRRAVYDAISAYRHELNKVKEYEPTGEEDFENGTNLAAWRKAAKIASKAGQKPKESEESTEPAETASS